MKSEARRQRAIHRVRVVVKTASNKMSAAPELNPGDWKWIEFISPYIDGCRHSGDNDREGWWVVWGSVNKCNQNEEKEHQEERKRGSGALPAVHWSFSTTPLFHYTITESKDFFFHSAMTLWNSAKPLLVVQPSRYLKMDTTGRVGLIPGWRESKGIGFPGVKMP